MSDQRQNSELPEKSVLSARITAIYPNKLVISLPDRSRGYVYKNDWTWDRSVRKTISEFSIDQKIEVVPLTAKGNKRFSIKHTGDPWEFAEGISLGKIYTGEIVLIRGNTVFIQLKPGITAVAYAKDMPILHKHRPEDVVSLGDLVRVSIVVFDRKARKISVSLLPPLQEPNLQSKFDLKSFFREKIQLIGQEHNDQKIAYNKRTTIYQVRKVESFNRILFVEDNGFDLGNITELIQTELNAHVIPTSSAADALKRISSGEPFDLVLTDVNLKDHENGLNLTEVILKKYPYLPVVLISNNPLGEYAVRELEEQFDTRLLFLEKPETLETARLFIEDLKLLQKGQIRITDQALMREKGAAEKEANVEPDEEFRKKIQDLLVSLALEGNLDYVFLVAVDLVDKKARLAGQSTRYPLEINLFEEDQLYFSPVREIAEYGEVFYIGQNTKEKEPINVHNFFEKLSFYSCYGVPVSTALTRFRYALVVLNHTPDMTGMNIQRIRTSAAQLALMLEQHAMQELLRQQQDLAAQGLLMGTMIHELNNILIPLIEFIGGSAESIDHGSKAEILETFHEVAGNVNRMKELTRAYTRLARQDFELLDVGEIIEKVTTQMRPLAAANAISIVITSPIKFPQIWGIQTHLEQILTNNLIRPYTKVMRQHDLQPIEIPERHAIDKLIEQILDDLEDRSYHCFLLMDEAEQLKVLEPNRLNALHAVLVNFFDNLTVVISGTNQLMTLSARQPWAVPFLNNFEARYIGNIPEADALALVRQSQLPEAERPIVPDAVAEEIVRYCGGHPFLLQRLCSNLFDNGTLREIRPSDLLLDGQLRHFIETDFNHLSSEEQETLLHFFGQDPKAILDLPSSCRSHLRELEQLGFLKTDGVRYELGNKFLAQWLDDKRSNKPQPSASTGATPKTRPKTAARKLFISYSKQDKAWLDKLKNQLRIYEREEMLTIWDDSKILPSRLWEQEIAEALNVAHIIIFLVSADMLATNYVMDVELPRAMRHFREGTGIVIPVIMRPCPWTVSDFRHFQALPEKGKPVSTFDNEDVALAEVVRRIEGVLDLA